MPRVKVVAPLGSPERRQCIGAMRAKRLVRLKKRMNFQHFTDLVRHFFPALSRSEEKNLARDLGQYVQGDRLMPAELSIILAKKSGRRPSDMYIAAVNEAEQARLTSFVRKPPEEIPLPRRSFSTNGDRQERQAQRDNGEEMRPASPPVTDAPSPSIAERTHPENLDEASMVSAENPPAPCTFISDSVSCELCGSNGQWGIIATGLNERDARSAFEVLKILVSRQ